MLRADMAIGDCTASLPLLARRSLACVVLEMITYPNAHRVCRLCRMYLQQQIWYMRLVLAYGLVKYIHRHQEKKDV